LFVFTGEKINLLCSVCFENKSTQPAKHPTKLRIHKTDPSRLRGKNTKFAKDSTSSCLKRKGCLFFNTLLNTDEELLDKCYNEDLRENIVVILRISKWPALEIQIPSSAGDSGLVALLFIVSQH